MTIYSVKQLNSTVNNKPGNAGSDALGETAGSGPVYTPVLNPGNVRPADNSRVLDKKLSCRSHKTSGSSGQRPVPIPPYKESLAKVDPSTHKPVSKTSCRKMVILGLVEKDNEVIKVVGKDIFCNKEWCPDCGAKNSDAHKRKVSRLLPKAMQMHSFGYFVIEFPDRYRHIKKRVYSKAGLRDTTNKIIEVLAGKRHHGHRRGGFFDRGFGRWHWFGDKKAGKYNPHFNVIVEAELLDKGKLEDIKMALRIGLNCPDLIVNYSFSNKPGKMFHKLKYITRSTFLDYDWCPYMAEEIYNFRNIRSWGKWDRPAVWECKGAAEYLKISILEDSKDPETGIQIHWQKPISRHWLDKWHEEDKVKELGGGYYEIDIDAYHGDKNRIAYPVTEVTEKDVKTARGYYKRYHEYAVMQVRHFNWLQDQAKRGWTVEEIKKHSRPYDSYWDDPESPGFIEEDYAA